MSVSAPRGRHPRAALLQVSPNLEEAARGLVHLRRDAAQRLHAFVRVHDHEVGRRFREVAARHPCSRNGRRLRLLGIAVVAVNAGSHDHDVMAQQCSVPSAPMTKGVLSVHDFATAHAVRAMA